MRSDSVAEIFNTMEYGPAPEADDGMQAWLQAHDNHFGLFINGEWRHPEGRSVAKSYAPPVSLHGDIGDGFCFDTNGIHRGTLPGTEARHVAIFEFHDDALERAFKEAKVMGAPFGK